MFCTMQYCLCGLVNAGYNSETLQSLSPSLIGRASLREGVSPRGTFYHLGHTTLPHYHPSHTTMSHYQTITLSHCHTTHHHTTMSHYQTITLSHYHTNHTPGHTWSRASTPPEKPPFRQDFLTNAFAIAMIQTHKHTLKCKTCYV